MTHLSLEQYLYKTHVLSGKILKILSIFTYPDLAKIILSLLDVRILLQKGQHISITFFYSSITHKKRKSKMKHREHIVRAIVDRIDKVNLKKRVIFGRFFVANKTQTQRQISMVYIDYVKVNNIYLSEYF